MREMDMERMVKETQEAEKITEQVEIEEADEQAEMNEGVKEEMSAEEAREQEEMNKGSIGYSSRYYMSEYERAVKNGNRIAQENALKNYAHAKAKEEMN